MTSVTEPTEYLVNNTPTHLTFKQGFLVIPPLGYVSLNASDKQDPTVVYALGREWAKVTTIKPNSTEDKKSVDITLTEPYRGLTFEELQVEQAKKEQKPEATGTALGAEDASEKSEGTSNTIGRIEKPVEISVEADKPLEDIKPESKVKKTKA